MIVAPLPSCIIDRFPSLRDQSWQWHSTHGNLTKQHSVFLSRGGIVDQSRWHDLEQQEIPQTVLIPAVTTAQVTSNAPVYDQNLSKR